jgi:hypothetical protein
MKLERWESSTHEMKEFSCLTSENFNEEKKWHERGQESFEVVSTKPRCFQNSSKGFEKGLKKVFKPKRF